MKIEVRRDGSILWKCSLAALLGLLSARSARAADWPGYRGPNHDGSSPEKGILKTWPKEGPAQLWKAPLGDSFGSFAVGGGKAFAFIQRKAGGPDREVALALDAVTGKELWATPLGAPTYEQEGGNGPRSTPTVDGGSVYFLGAYLVLSCLDASNGKLIWQHDLVAQYGGKVIRWTTPVCKDGYLYGLFGFKEFGTAPLNCIEIATGKEVWSQPGFGSGGGTILVDGHVLVQGDKGPLVLVEATPSGYKEVARTQAFGGKCWTMAVVSNGRIYARNTKEGVCLDLSGKSAQN